MMWLIVAHHYVVNSGVLDAILEPPYSWQHYFLYVFGMWGKIGINCFVLITGYFMCKSDITVREFLKLLLEILFYNVVIYTIFAISGYEPFSIAGLCYAVNPIKDISKDFIGCFLIYYLLIPYLNKVVNDITKRQRQVLLAICFLFFVIWDRLPGIEYTYNYVGWFCVLHFIASYIRFYLPQKDGTNNRREALLISTGGVFAIFSVITQCFMIEKGWHVGWQYKWVVDCNAVVGLLSSIMMFIGFKDLKMKNRKWINVIAASTFAVLLIHASSDTMRRWLWEDVCNNIEWIDSVYMPLHAIGCVTAIFVACIIIDQIRIYAVEKPTFKLIDKYLSKYGIK